MSELFLLDFEGTYNDSVGSIVPTTNLYTSLDTSVFYHGVSSLSLPQGGSGRVIYPILGLITGDFHLTYFLNIDADITGPGSCAYFQLGGVNDLSYYPNIQIYPQDGFKIYISDKNGTYVGSGTFAALSTNTWHKVEISISGRVLTFLVDNTILGTYTAAVDNPFDGFTYLQLNNNFTNKNSWFDYLSIDSGSDSFENVINIVLSGSLINESGGSPTPSSPNSGDLEINLPIVRFSAHGAGYLKFNLPVVSFSAHGKTDNVGRMNIYLPVIKTAFHAVQEQKIELNINLPVVNFSAHGFLSGVGELNINLPVIKFAAHGLSGGVAHLNIILPIPVFKASAYWQGLNYLNIELPVVQFNAHAKSKHFLALCMNTKNSALTEYDHYDYNSLFVSQGKMYGAKSDGIYELSGNSDNGTSIPWAIKTGKFDLEDSFLKKARYVWLAYKPSGDLCLIVDDGDKEYEYAVESYKQIDNAVRIKLGKGFRNRYIQLELRNVSNEKIFLDHMRLFAEPIKEHKR